jgi:hypothetical protein
MKKRLLILVGFLLYFTTIQAQQSDHFLFEGNGVVDYNEEGAALKMQMQIGAGLPYNIYKNTINNINVTTGFPYGVLYIGPTFRVDKFEVSKGYFTDRVNINWQLSASNRDKVTNIEVYRRVLGSNQEFVFLANLSKDDSEYRDELIEGGVLFEYQIRAIGIPITNGSIGVRTLNYMEGIGFRNPTATVSGGITFEGGSPVQDVKVSAEPIGAENSSATSLYVPTAPDGGVAKIEDITNIKADSITFQTWLVNDTNIFSFKLSDDSSDTYEIYAGNWNNETIDFNLQKNNDQLSGIKIAHSYPTGEIDAAGNDKFAAISSLGQKGFVHLSLVIRDGKKAQFFINGREINDTYEAAIKEKNPNLTIRIDDFTADTVSLANNPSTVNLTELVLGNGYSNFFMDEARVWNRALSLEEIRRDYRRYLGGGEAGLAVYLRMDEGEGDYLYDLSKDGFTQNKNDALLSQISNTTVKFSDTIPTNEQLGVFGITDKNGSYIISGIGYKGTGESFEILPSLGVHKFEPGSQTVFLGSEAPVVNQLNFTDVSSFKFNGRIVYNVQDVFSATTPEKITSVRDAGYNKYTIVEDGKTKTVNKGQYYYEGGTNNNGVYTGGVLKKYPVIGVEGANVLIDGNVVFDEDNQPVLTNEDGEFTVNVPIGNHKVEVQKSGHTFELNGRFPEIGTFEFFVDQTEPQYFIDDTRVTLVGKVVGGKKEFEKPIGFGANGLFEVVSNKGDENELTETVSSLNNIGVAQITFKGDVNSPEKDKIVLTNAVTGEYKVDLIPYIYTILSGTGTTKGITIPANTLIDNSISTSNETLDLREIPDFQKSEFIAQDGTTYESEAYQYIKSFRYNSPVSLTLLDQEFEEEVTIDGEVYDISGLDAPIYIQNNTYKMVFEVTQNYINKDGVEDIISKEIFNEGEFSITNNLEIPNSGSFATTGTNYTYSFRAGEPNISGSFEKTISVEYTISGQSAIKISNLSSFKGIGVVKGGRSNSGVSFATVAPETPDIILRDPPGTNSFATIAKGTKFSVTKEYGRTDNDSEDENLFISAGPTFTISTGQFILTDVETNFVNAASESVSKTTVQNSATTFTDTYEFNQTISTSSEPQYVGAEGDLYIGNSTNIYYGVVDNMVFSDTEPPATESDNTTSIISKKITVKDKNGNDKDIYLSIRKAIVEARQPTNTFFIYSQKYILETLFDDYIALSNAAPEEVTFDSDSNEFATRTKSFYLNQIERWKKIIQENERQKYEAFKDAQQLKGNAIGRATSNFSGDVQNAMLSIIDQNFFSNKSFDAGLGELTNTVSLFRGVNVSNSTSIEISDKFNQDLGVFVNNVGGSLSTTVTSSDTESQDIDDFNEETTTISYTLKDNDKNNAFSVDIVNLFDGNGPIFITKAGATSCPYEEATVSNYYNSQGHNPNVVGLGGQKLSEATNRVYDVEISVVKRSITNVPEDENAVFTLLLKNTSETQSDLEYVLNFGNLQGLEINLESNGLDIFLPFNETVEFPLILSKPSGTSDYDIDGIEIFIYSPCVDDLDTKRSNLITLDVEFKKSCSNVSISSPEDNWIFNRNEGINADGTNNSLPITFTDFNTGFNGFEKIELQYRNASAATWFTLASYYGSEDLKSTAGDSDGIVISDSDIDFTYNWDVVDNNIADGDYEFRAIAFCTDNITNSSEIISGTVNLNAPLVFGTPKPTDGILDPGEDISIRFNEAIFARTTEDITVTGLQNQQKIDHSVSVFLDGSTNQIELPNQRLDGSSFTLQFWLDSNTTGTGNLVSQENGINIKIDGNHLEFAIGGQLVSTKTQSKPINDSRYNFYSFVYQNGNFPQLLILENGETLAKLDLNNDIDINTSASIFIGGQNVTGNLHDVRLWSKPFTYAQAGKAKDLTLTGRELNLLGYWKLDEGFGKTALDKAKRKNAIVNLDWAIKPVGTGYEFKNNTYIKLDSVKFVQPTNFQDITLSFWVKPSATSAGTIFSNGRGTDNDKEVILTNGFRNKWSVNLNTGGNLELVTENVTYPLTSNPLTTDNWNHVAIVRKVGGSLNSYINGEEVTSVSAALTGGFSGSRILIGARLYTDPLLNLAAENHFTGLLDEVRFWNTARSIEQIKRDRYFEIDNNTEGLILKMDFNEDASNKNGGPEYNHLSRNSTKVNNFSTLSDGAVKTHIQDTPPLKPQLQFTPINFTTVINGDEMIISPNLTDAEWSLFEGEIIDFTVAGLTDTHFNRQSSPVTWSALVNRQELEWFTEKKSKEIITEKTLGDSYSFTMDVVNIGGSNQPFTISGLPTWMQAEITTGSIAPNSNREIIFTVDNELSMGNYTADIFLETASGFNDRLSFNLRVLSEAPNWFVNAADYATSMNFIGKIEIDGEFSRDTYTKVGAFVADEPRGEAFLKYDAIFDSYFVFLTAYSNSGNSQEKVTFKIWDAINGKIIVALIDNATEVDYLINGIEGSKSSPKIFSNSNLAEQNLALNKGWTWVSLYANDPKLLDVTQTFSTLNLAEGDGLKSQTQFSNYENGFWSGDLTQLSTTEMYKIKLENKNELRLLGSEILAANFNINIDGKSSSNDGNTPQWNWLPFPIHRDVALQEALAFYEPTDGDVIKDQFNFAIYDASSGWSGTLNYLQSGNGYMLNAAKTQTFNYPDGNVLAKSAVTNKVAQKIFTDSNNFAAYSSNMNIVAEVIDDENFTKVLVYDANNVLRGISDIVDINNKRISFITAFSNTQEHLKFVLANDLEQLDINKDFLFVNNLVMGDLKNPVQLSSKALSLYNLVLSDAVLYPNPFNNTITIDLSNENIELSKVEIFNTIGVSLISKRASLSEKTTINTANLANGIYLIRLTDNTGKFVVKKMIKE